LQPLTITAKSEATLFVTLTLRNLQGGIITDPNELSIPTDFDSIDSFRDGTYKVFGNLEQVNEHLRNVTVEMGNGFKDQDFTIEINAVDVGNQISKSSSIAINYDCVSLPPELKKLIADQQSQKGKKIVMDLIRYFKDPDDPEFTKAIFNLTANSSLVDITKLNKSSFAITLNKNGEYMLRASLLDECHNQVNQTFKLSGLQNPSEDVKALPTIMAVLATAGTTLFIVGLCCICAKHKEIINFCKKLGQQDRQEEKLDNIVENNKRIEMVEPGGMKRSNKKIEGNKEGQESDKNKYLIPINTDDVLLEDEMKNSDSEELYQELESNPRSSITNRVTISKISPLSPTVDIIYHKNGSPNDSSSNSDSDLTNNSYSDKIYDDKRKKNIKPLTSTMSNSKKTVKLKDKSLEEPPIILAGKTKAVNFKSNVNVIDKQSNKQNMRY
jgi:hypothetical protein